MPQAPRVRRPTRSDLVREMNRDLLVGLLIPGRDRFEVRGWVRWLLGDPSEHVPRDPVDRARFEAMQALDGDAIDRMRHLALDTVTRVRGIHGSGAYQRGVAAHDSLMQTLLSDEGNVHSVALSAFRGDTDRLLDMMHVDAEDLEHPEFLDGFQWANHELAEAMQQALREMTGD